MFTRSTSNTYVPGWIGLAVLLSWALHAAPAAASEAPGTLMEAIGAKVGVASGHAAELAEAIDQLAVVPGLPGDIENEAPGEDLDRYEREHGLPEAQGGGYPAGGTGKMPSPWRDGKGRISKPMRAGLLGIEGAMTDAKVLANGHANLAPGIEHVLTNVRLLGEGKTLPANATSLMHELEIELFALGNNALILEAEDNLHAAAAEMAHGSPERARGYLEAASGALDRADERGAYHIFDDRQTLTALLKDMHEGDGDAAPETSRPLIARLITDIHEHLSDLGGE